MNASKIQPYFLITLLTGALVLSFFILRPFLIPIALAAVFAVVLEPLYKWLRDKMENWSGAAALFTVAIGVVLILLPLTILGTLVVKEASSLYVTLTDGSGAEYIKAPLLYAEETLRYYFPDIRFSEGISADISTYTKHGLEWIIQNIGSAFSKAASFILSFFIFFIALYYFLRDGEKIKRAITEISPLPNTDDETVFARLGLAINSVIKGSLSIAFIQGVLTAIGFTLFNIPNSILWGTVAAVGALIPGVGTALVFLPAILFLFFTGESASALGLLAWGVVAVGLIDNFLGPKLIGKRMHLHPLLILLSVLGGIAFFGPVGIFLGPLSLSLLFAFLSIYSETAKTA